MVGESRAGMQRGKYPRGHRVFAVERETVLLVDGLGAGGGPAHRAVAATVRIQPGYIAAGTDIAHVGCLVDSVECIRNTGAVARVGDTLVQHRLAFAFGGAEQTFDHKIVAQAPLGIDIEKAAGRIGPIAIEAFRVSDVLWRGAAGKNDRRTFQHAQREAVVGCFGDDDRVEYSREYLAAARAGVGRRRAGGTKHLVLAQQHAVDRAGGEAAVVVGIHRRVETGSRDIQTGIGAPLCRDGAALAIAHAFDELGRQATGQPDAIEIGGGQTGAGQRRIGDALHGGRVDHAPAAAGAVSETRYRIAPQIALFGEGLPDQAKRFIFVLPVQAGIEIG